MKKMKLNIQLFNGSVAIQTITETTDVDLNQSTFTIPAKMTTSGETHNYSNASMTMQWKYESASSWTSLSKQTFSINKNSNITKSWTLTLTHKPDGTLENVQFRVQWYITDSTNGTTGATTKVPTTIPRASQPSVNMSAQACGQSVVISTNRYSTSFTHTLSYTFYNSSGTLATNVGDSYTWSIPLNLMNQMPNTTQGTCTIICKTYNGSTLIGEKNTTLYLTVPSSVVPTISSVARVEVGDVPSSWNVYVQNKSKLRFTYTANGTYSSTISSYSTTGDGYTYTTNPATTNYLRSTGNLTFNFKVVDSRGRQATTSQTITIYAYSNPTITTAQVQRCNANGTIDKNGQYMYISYGGSISACNSKNTPNAVYKVGYRVHNTGNYSYVPLTTNANSYSASGVLFTDGIKSASSGGTKVEFNTNNTYDIQFYVEDYFTTSTNVQTLDSGFDLMNFNASGKAMAIGKVSEAGANEELLEIGMNTEIDGTLNVSGNVQASSYNGTIFNLGTNNSADTWVPVMRNNYLEHRVIPTTYNSTAPTLTGLTINGNETISGNQKIGNSRKYCSNFDLVIEGGGYVRLCRVASSSFGSNGNLYLKAFTGDGWNGRPSQNAMVIAQIKKSYDSMGSALWYGCTYAVYGSYNNNDRVRIYIRATSIHYLDIYLYSPYWYSSGRFELEGQFDSVSNVNDWRSASTPTDGTEQSSTGGLVQMIKSLYDNSSGTAGNITLSETSANFTYLEIFYYYYTGNSSTASYNSVKVYSPSGKNAMLVGSYDNGTNFYQEVARYSISGTALNRNNAIRWRIGTSGNATRTNTTSSDQSIYIVRVVGYR